MFEKSGVPSDTSKEAEELLIKLLREMTLEEKLQKTFGLMQFAKNLTIVGIKYRHPDADEEGIRRRYAAIVLGEKLAEELYGWDLKRDGY